MNNTLRLKFIFAILAVVVISSPVFYWARPILSVVPEFQEVVLSNKEDLYNQLIFEYKIVNHGLVAGHIGFVATGCGCTSYSLDNHVVPPLGQITVKVKVWPDDRGDRKFNAFVHFDVPNSLSLELPGIIHSAQAVDDALAKAAWSAP